MQLQNTSDTKIQAKKSLGQNFLHSKNALAQMCKASNVQKGDFVIEIGPGKGALTQMLLETGATVLAIEKDDRLIPYLNETFADFIKKGSLIVIHDDALTLEIKKLAGKNLAVTQNTKNPFGKDYKIIANIPYYITGALLRICLEQKIKPENITFLVQKEVADRIVASDGKNSLLSLSVQFYGKAKKILNVPNKSFRPIPKVHSAIINVQIDRNETNQKLSAKFFDLIHRGFAHKRKTLRKNLVDSGLPKEVVEKAFINLNIDEKERAEDINFEKWILLCKEVY